MPVGDIVGGRPNNEAIEWESKRDESVREHQPKLSYKEIQKAQGRALTTPEVKSKWVADFEAAYETHQGDISPNFFMQFTPDEMRLYGGPEFYDVARYVENSLLFQNLERAQQVEIDRQFEEAQKLRKRRGFLGRLLNQTGQRLGEDADPELDDEKLLEQITLQVQGRFDELHEESISASVDVFRQVINRMVVGDRGSLRVGGDTDRSLFGDEELNLTDERRLWEQTEEFLDAAGITDVRSLSPEEIENLVSAHEQIMREEIRSNPKSVREIVMPWEGQGFVMGLLSPIEKGIHFATMTAGNAIEQLPEHNDLRELVDWQIRRSEEAKQATIRELEMGQGRPSEEKLANYLHRDARIVAEQMSEQDPDLYTEYVRMAGGDETMAMGFIGADLMEQITPEEQTQYLDQMLKQEDYIMSELKDQNFTFGDGVLELLATYSRNVAGRATTIASLLVTDEDLRADADNMWDLLHDLNDESEKYGHTASEALGIDGTGLGLTLDMGGSIFFDPATWVYGPRMSPKGHMLSTAAGAKTFAKSRFFRQSMLDALDTARSPSRGAAAFFHLTDWMPSHIQAKVLDLAGWNPSILPRGAWRKQSPKAIEVKREFLDDLLSPEQIKGANVEELRNIHDSVLANGFDEAITVKISRGDGHVWIDDGVKRVLASDDISHVPVVLKVTDEVAPGKLMIPGYADDMVVKMQRVLDEVPDKGTANTPLDIDSQRHIYNVTKDKISPQVDASLGSFERNGKTFTVHKHFEEGRTTTVDRALTAPNEITYALDDAGELVAFYDQGHLIQAPGHKGVLHQVLDVAEEAGQSFLPRLLDRALRATEGMGSFTEDGVRFVKNAVKSRMEQALPQTSRFGRNIDELLQEGESLGKVFKKPGKNLDADVRPDSVLPRRMLLGDIDEEALMALGEEAVMLGHRPQAAQRYALARASTEVVRKLLKANAPGKWMMRYMTPQSVITRLELAGLHSFDKIIDTSMRLWGDDTAKLDGYLARLMDWQRKNHQRTKRAVDRLNDEVAPRQQRLTEWHDMVGDVWDDQLKGLRETLGPDAEEFIQATKNRQQLRRVVAEEEMSLRRLLAEIDGETGVVGATDELEKIIIEMWEDYFDTYIATNPAWKHLKRDPETGAVPWDQLQKGQKTPPGQKVAGNTGDVVAESMAKVAEELGVDAEKLIQRLSYTHNAKLAMDLPLSPLEMVAAREIGGSAYTRFTHNHTVHKMREGFLAFHRLWTIDKVFTLSTAATVSFDELLRIFHRFGPHSIGRWASDRAIMTEARVNQLIHGKGVKGRFSKDKGAPYLSAKKQERLQELRDYPTRLAQIERNSFEQSGLGWEDIEPGQAGYRDAALQYTGGFLQDSGVRAMLRGREEFRNWFFGPDGERLRRTVVMQMQDGKPVTSVVTSADEFYDGWMSVFDVFLQPARKAGKYDEVLEAWKNTAKKIDEGGGRPHNLPDVALNHFGAVRGVKRDLPNKMSMQRFQENFFDKLFMDPVNYRRGFLADLTRKAEKERLVTLFHSQGKRILTDAEVEARLGLQGLAGAQRTGLHEVVQEMALNAGLIPESYVDDIVEQAVLAEIENTLYAFDMSTRLGSQAKGVFPFGKPWADMAGFWGREMLSKPVLRGWINQKNALGLRTLHNKVGVPVPNKAHALISRLAHTDFTIDKGWMGEGGNIVPGAEETNFSPLFFLPTGTQGDNPFAYMIPGLGIVPMVFMDYLMAWMHDPVNEPEKYQDLQDKIAQFIPAANYTQGGITSRLAGGGTGARIFGAVVDLAGMAGGDSFFNITSEMGDITREIDRTREISALLADPEEMELLLSADTPEEAEQLLSALSVRADKQASQSHLASGTLRYMAPASHEFSDALAEIENVWLEAGSQAPFQHLLRGMDMNEMTDEQKRTLANDIRSEFFRLENWQKDVLLLKQPSLAVNMVGSWEWTPAAVNKDIEGTQYAYRAGGTKADLARHEYLVKAGLIRPVQPIVRARRILGTIHNAKVSAAKTLYDTQVGVVNDAMWNEHVDEKTKGKLEWVLNSEFGQSLDLRTVEEVWKNWRRLEEDLEIWIAEQKGIDPVKGESRRKADETEFDRLRSRVSIPDDMKPWGTTFPGLEEEEVTNKFNEWVIRPGDVTRQQRELAEALGININAGTTGEELFYEVQQIITQQDKPIFSVVRPDYDRYIADRTVGTGRNQLFEAAQSDLVSEEYQERLHRFMFWHEQMTQRQKNLPYVPLKDQVKMREEYLYIMNGAKDQNMDWEGIWKEQYERKYGPLDWTPPAPKSPFDENGDVAMGVHMPYVKHVVDGDTILVQEYKGSPRLNSVRLLGIRAEEIGGLNSATALEQEEKLKRALLNAAENGDNIYLVRDLRFGNTDRYGRMLAWLWIGDTPFYNKEDLLPHQDPSGGK